MDRRTCIRNACVLSMSETLGDIDEADILVDGSKIAAIGKDLPTEGTTVVDASGMIAMPGFVDCHRHLWQASLKHLACDWSLTEYLLATRALLAGAFEPGDLFVGQHAGGLEALDAGVTTIVDHAHNLASPEHVEAAIEGIRKAQVRSIFCYGMGDVAKDGNLAGGFATPAWHFEDFQRVSSQQFGQDGSLVTLGVALNELPFSSIGDQKKEIEFARENGAQLVTFHLSIPGKEHIVELAEAGLLGPDMLITHGFFMTDRELELLAMHGASVVTTPDTELQMGMGYGVTLRARQFGVGYALGVDIVSSNSGDLFNQMRLSLQTQRAFANQRLLDAGQAVRKVAVTVRDVLMSATIGGARAAGLGAKVGSLEPGKEADVILIDRNRLGLQPGGDPAASIVLYASPGDVHTVMVGGKIVKQQGKLLGVDAAQLYDQLSSSRQAIMKRACDVDPEVIRNLRAVGLPESLVSLRAITA